MTTETPKDDKATLCITAKYLYVNNSIPPQEDTGFPWVGAHLIGSYGRSIAHYQKMVDEMRKSFPDDDDTEFRCSYIRESRWCKGCAIVTWNGYVDISNLPEGWVVTKLPDYEYG